MQHKKNLLNVQRSDTLESDAHCSELMIHTEDVEIISSLIFCYNWESQEKYQPDWIFCSHLIPVFVRWARHWEGMLKHDEPSALTGWIKGF